MDNLILQIVSLLFGGGSLITLIGFYLSRKKNRLEYAANLKRALDEMSGDYTKVLDKLGHVLDELSDVKAQNTALKREVQAVRCQNENLTGMVSELQSEVDSLRRVYEADTGKPAPAPQRRKYYHPAQTRRAMGTTLKLDADNESNS